MYGNRIKRLLKISSHQDSIQSEKLTFTDYENSKIGGDNNMKNLKDKISEMTFNKFMIVTDEDHVKEVRGE